MITHHLHGMKCGGDTDLNKIQLYWTGIQTYTESAAETRPERKCSRCLNSVGLLYASILSSLWKPSSGQIPSRCWLDIDDANLGDFILIF